MAELCAKEEEEAPRVRARTVALFRKAIAAEKVAGDPWARFRLHDLAAERCRRHKYDVAADRWTVDETLVKVERESFDRGSMRTCFRLKKVSQQPGRARLHALKWRSANNYVGKQYEGREGDGARVLGDVKMQRTASALADKFDALRPPKSVIIIDCSAIELYERSEPEWMVVERYMTGHDARGRGFMKHSSNVGYSSSSPGDETHAARLTPQVFSAATFWLTEGAAMVTDVQGIGELYTDPQIHSAAGGLGPGDLGRRGMALFFASFDASKNPLFHHLAVPSIELTPSQRARFKVVHRQSQMMKTLTTRCFPPPARLVAPNLDKSAKTFLEDPNTIEAMECALDRADRAAAAALGKDGSAKPPMMSATNRAVGEVHLAMAMHETAGTFAEPVGPHVDAGSAVFHCALACAKGGNATAAHALARWHADLPATAVVPRYSELKHAYPATAGRLFVFAADRGDAAAAAAAAYAFSTPCWGLTRCDDRAAAYLAQAIRAAPRALGAGLAAAQVDDAVFVDYGANGFYHEARISRVNGDGTTDVRYVEFEASAELAVPWARLRMSPPDHTLVGLPAAGADLPPLFKLLSDLADLVFASKNAALIPDDLKRENLDGASPGDTAGNGDSARAHASRLLYAAARTARALRAPALVDGYLRRAELVAG